MLKSTLRLDLAITILIILTGIFAILFFLSPLIAQIYFSGVLLGGLYGIVALGLSLIFGIMKLLNLAHGEFMILSSYLTFWLFSLLGLDPFLSIVIVVPALFFAGLFVQRLLIESVVKLGPNQPIVITFGLVLIMQTIFDTLWTSDSRFISTSYSGMRFLIGQVSIPLIRFIVLIIAAAGMFTLYLLVTRTFIGKAMRATALDWKAAEYMGVRVKRIYQLAFGFGTAFAGLAGALLATVFAFDPASGMTYFLKALAVIVMAGVGNITGLLVSGLLIGAIESVGSYVAGGGFRDAISFVVFFAVLLIRPTGLFKKSTW
jgi:branched-chain amino acid transport system permease protein